MKVKFSVIIPTMFKCPEILSKLVDTLHKEEAVGEIILFINTPELTPLHLIDEAKVRYFSTGRNVYVNPAWNFCVKESKYDHIAILNDDILIPENIFTILSQVPWDQIGIAGIFEESIKPIDNLDNYKADKIGVLKVETRWNCFGMFMVMEKKNYIPIPESIKIWCGDDILFHTLRNDGKINYMLDFLLKTNKSITSALPEFDEIKKRDEEYYKEYKIKQGF